MKNKKGFTLIELLATLAIIALISAVAIPNIVNLSNGIRKDNMLDDAKKLISLAKYKVNKDYEIRNNPPHTFTFNELNVNDDIGKDPDGGDYDQVTSKVVYSIENNVAQYCVVLIGKYRAIGSESECIKEDNLYSRSNVVDRVSTYN